MFFIIYAFEEMEIQFSIPFLFPYTFTIFFRNEDCIKKWNYGSLLEMKVAIRNETPITNGNEISLGNGNETCIRNEKSFSVRNEKWKWN